MTSTMHSTVESVKRTANISASPSFIAGAVTSLKARLKWLVEASKKAQGLTSGRAIARKAGLSETHLNDLINESDPNPTIEVLRKVAKATNVSLGWLVTGRGSPTPYDGEASDPLPALPSAPGDAPSAPYVVHEDERSLVSAAFIPGKHTFLSSVLVLEHLRAHTLELPPDVEPVPWVGRLLDAAADLQRKKQPVTASLVMNEALRRAALLNPEIDRRSEELTDEATRELEEKHGVVPPVELSPLMRQARERDAIETQEEAAELKQRAGKRPPKKSPDGSTPRPPSSATRKK